MLPDLSQIRCVRIYPLAIPMRRKFEHATQSHDVADPVVVSVELADGTVGYGETLPRSYVSGETLDSVVGAIRSCLLEELVTFRPTCYPEALECVDALPLCDASGCVIVAARAAIELALLDAYSKHYKRAVTDVVGWMGVPGLGTPGSIGHARYSGIISGGDPAKIKSFVRKMRLFRLRDFKLKVGYEDDIERVRCVARALGRSLGKTTTLRLDANGGWTLGRAGDVLGALGDVPIACVEQPLSIENDNELMILREATGIDVMPDESLVTYADAERLIDLGVADVFNIRISKNGGFLPALKLANLANKHGCSYQLGCMVGETSILSAVGRRFLQCVPNVRFTEGSYGRFLLSGDVTRHRLGFTFGGRVKPLSGLGWGVEVDERALTGYARPGVIELPL